MTCVWGRVAGRSEAGKKGLVNPGGDVEGAPEI